MSAISALPGSDLVAQGLADLAAGRETVEALLVSVDAPQLRALGFAVGTPIAEPELRLYERLSRELGDGAHGRYNTMLRRLVSFRRAAAATAAR